jgi:hypothetical protein
MEHFRIGINPAHTANSLQVTRSRLLEHGISVIGITAILRFARFVAQRFDNLRESHFIRFTDAHVDNFCSRGLGHRRALGSLYFFEFVNRNRLAVLAPADAFGKKLLNNAKTARRALWPGWDLARTLAK